MLDLNAIRCFVFLTESTQKSFIFFFQSFKARNYRIIILLQKKKFDSITKVNGQYQVWRPARKLSSNQAILTMKIK